MAVKWLKALAYALLPQAARRRARYYIQLQRAILSNPTVVATPLDRSAIVIAPHPDDETIGCGGTVSAHCRNGHTVSIVFLTDGSTGTSFANYSREKLTRLREEEARHATAALGTDRIVFLRHPDGELDGGGAVVEDLQELLERACPEVVYTPYFLDSHRDHRAGTIALSRAVPLSLNVAGGGFPSPPMAAAIATRTYPRCAKGHHNHFQPPPSGRHASWACWGGSVSAGESGTHQLDR